MKNFKLCQTEVNIEPILDELKRNHETWRLNTQRQQNIAVQRHTESIFLRSGHQTDKSVRTENEQKVKDAPAAPLFPRTISWLNQTATLLDGELSRVLFAKLQPRTQVYRHIDHGEYYARRDRYHLVLQSSGGSQLIAGDEEVHMKERELWWFDNKKPHEAFNHSDDHRIHLIFDILPTPRSRVWN